MEKLGIEPVLLTAQIVNFFIILIVLNKLLYKPILNLLEKRKKEIIEGIELTEKMRKEEEKLKAKEEAAMAKAREEALKIIESAKTRGKELEKEIVTKAHEQSSIIISRAKEEAEQLKKESQVALQQQAVELATVMAQRLLSTVMGDKEQKIALGKRMKDLEVWAEGQQ